MLYNRILLPEIPIYSQHTDNILHCIIYFKHQEHCIQVFLITYYGQRSIYQNISLSIDNEQTPEVYFFYKDYSMHYIIQVKW